MRCCSFLHARGDAKRVVKWEEVSQVLLVFLEEKKKSDEYSLREGFVTHSRSISVAFIGMKL